MIYTHATADCSLLQVVGPISASSSSLVATVLPTPVSSLGSLPHTVLTAATATTTSITKILSHGRQEQDRPGQPAEPVIVNQVLVPPPPSQLASRRDVNTGPASQQPSHMWCSPHPTHLPSPYWHTQLLQLAKMCWDSKNFASL